MGARIGAHGLIKTGEHASHLLPASSWNLSLGNPSPLGALTPGTSPSLNLICLIDSWDMAARLLDWGQENEAGPRQLGTLGQWLCTNLSGRFQYFQTRYHLTGALLANHQHGAPAPSLSLPGPLALRLSNLWSRDTTACT